MEHLTQVLHDLIIHFGYVGLFFVVLLGNLGMPAALEIMVPTAGGLAAQGHLPAIGPLAGWVVVGTIALCGELVGTSIFYAIGYYGGLPFVHRYGKYIRFRQHEYDRVHAFFVKYGRSTVFWCRFIPFIRGFSSLPAGISRMPKRWFFLYTLLGSAVFCFGLAYLGDVAGKNLDAIIGQLHKAAVLIVIGVVLLAIAAAAWWRLRKKREAADLAG
ncbi:MAG TPA: DedA family protein [Candidatus Elarobacter sp.]|jgi:membrane protein DedA with SNARE-associated domain